MCYRPIDIKFFKKVITCPKCRGTGFLDNIKDFYTVHTGKKCPKCEGIGEVEVLIK